MTKQAPILNESMTKTGGISVIRASGGLKSEMQSSSGSK
jgi:hypothetical protein